MQKKAHKRYFMAHNSIVIFLQYDKQFNENYTSCHNYDTDIKSAEWRAKMNMGEWNKKTSDFLIVCQVNKYSGVSMTQDTTSTTPQCTQTGAGLHLASVCTDIFYICININLLWNNVIGEREQWKWHFFSSWTSLSVSNIFFRKRMTSLKAQKTLFRILSPVT